MYFISFSRSYKKESKECTWCCWHQNRQIKCFFYCCSQLSLYSVHLIIWWSSSSSQYELNNGAKTFLKSKSFAFKLDFMRYLDKQCALNVSKTEALETISSNSRWSKNSNSTFKKHLAPLCNLSIRLMSCLSMFLLLFCLWACSMTTRLPFEKKRPFFSMKY